MQLARRLTLSLSLLTLTTLAVSFSVAYLLVSREQIRDLDAALRTEAGVVSALLWQDPDAVTTLNSGKYPVADPLQNLQTYAIAFDAAGAPIAWTHDSIPTPPHFDAFGVHLPLSSQGHTFDFTMLGRPLRGIVIPISAGVSRRLFVGVSLAGVEDEMAFMLRLFASLMAIAMLSTIGIASWVGRRVAGGVQRIAFVARSVAEGNLEARVTEGHLGSTEIQSLAVDLNHMITKLGELVSAHKVFASYAAHELRSPLAAMRGELQLALRRRRSVEEYEVVLASALEDAEGLINLAEDLLTLARVQGSASTAETARVGDIIEDSVHLVSGIAQMRSVDIQVTTGDESLIVFGHRTDLSRVLRNVIENAIAHSHAGAQVQLETASTEKTVCVLLTDEGPGIPLDEQAHVFQPFFRGSGGGSHNRSGAGLGLAIARGIIEAQGGNIRVDPDYHQGARFIIELPRVYPDLP